MAKNIKMTENYVWVVWMQKRRHHVLVCSFCVFSCQM